MRALLIQQAATSVALPEVRGLHNETGPPLHLESELHWVPQPEGLLLVLGVHVNRHHPVLVHHFQDLPYPQSRRNTLLNTGQYFELMPLQDSVAIKGYIQA